MTMIKLTKDKRSKAFSYLRVKAKMNIAMHLVFLLAHQNLCCKNQYTRKERQNYHPNKNQRSGKSLVMNVERWAHLHRKSCKAKTRDEKCRNFLPVKSAGQILPYIIYSA